MNAEDQLRGLLHASHPSGKVRPFFHDQASRVAMLEKLMALSHRFFAATTDAERDAIAAESCAVMEAGADEVRRVLDAREASGGNRR